MSPETGSFLPRLVGMVHAAALPGTPRSSLAVAEIARRAAGEARTLADAGFGGVIVENMHDVPYLRRTVGPEIVAAMTRVAAAVRDAVPELVVGVQVLAGANREALAVAHAAGAQFVRAEGFVFAAVADEGLLEEADAGPLLRERRRIGADDVRILVDVKKKHSSHAITADVPITDAAKAAVFCGADGVIVTGGATGEATKPGDVHDVARAVGVPVAVGSGVTADTAAVLLEHADCLIVGSCLKQDGHWSKPVDAVRAREFVAACG